MNNAYRILFIVGIALSLNTVMPAPEIARSNTYRYYLYFCGRYGSWFAIRCQTVFLEYNGSVVTRYVMGYDTIYDVDTTHIIPEDIIEIYLPTDGERIELEESYIQVSKGNTPYFMPTDWRNVLQNVSDTLEEFRENGTISEYHASAGELDEGVFYNITVTAPAWSDWIEKNGTGEVHFYVKTRGNRTVFLVLSLRLLEHGLLWEFIWSSEKLWFMEKKEIVSNTGGTLFNIDEHSVMVREYCYGETHAGELEDIMYCNEDWNFTDIDIENMVCNATYFSMYESVGRITYHMKTIDVWMWTWKRDSLTFMAPFGNGVVAPVYTVPNWCENELSLLYTMNVSVANYTEFRRIYYGHYAVHIKGGPVSVQNASDSERYLVGDFDLNDEIRYDANTGILQNHTSTFNMYFADGTTISVLGYRGTEPYRIREEEKGYDMTVIWIVSAVVVIAVAGAIIMYKKHVIRL